MNDPERRLILVGAGVVVGLGLFLLRPGDRDGREGAGDPERTTVSGIVAFAEGVDSHRLDEGLTGIGVTRPAGARMVLVVVFSTTDCGACLSEAAVWQDLYRRFASRGLQVLGVGHARNRGELDAFVRDEGLTFPVYWDPGETVKERLSLLNSPGKILVDEAGAIILTDPPNNSPRRQRAFAERIEGILENGG